MYVVSLCSVADLKDEKIWRCWALYSQNIKIVILPCLCLLTEIGEFSSAH